jgi:hypothetical protein
MEMKALEFCLEHNIDKDGVFGSKEVFWRKLIFIAKKIVNNCLFVFHGWNLFGTFAEERFNCIIIRWKVRLIKL